MTTHLASLDPTPLWTSAWTTDLTLATAPPVAGVEGQPQRQGGQPQTGADGSQPIGGQGGQQGPPPSPFGGPFMLIILGFFVLLILMQVFAGRKEKKRRQEMLSSIAKHDRVQTAGGVIGTVAEVRDDEIVLKVDESTNTKIRFARASVQQVLKKAGGGETQPAEEPQMAQAGA